MKVQVKRAFKSYFYHQKTTKRQTGSAWNFLQSPLQVCRGAHIPYFKINSPIFCCPLFLEEYLNPQGRINKLANEHSVDYHLSPSELTSRIHLLIFIWTPKDLYLQNIFSIFFPTCMAIMIAEIFHFYGVKITENANWIYSFSLMP